jgi:hypothetical protein
MFPTFPIRGPARLHRLANVVFFLLVAIAAATLFPIFSDRSSAVHTIGWVIIAFFGTMTIGYLAIQRGIRPEGAGNPRDALAFLERRLRIEHLTAHLIRWAYAGLCIAFVFVFPRAIAGQPDAGIQLAVTLPAMAVLLVVSFTAPWWVARRNRKHQEEIGRWRRWMDEQHL